MTIVEELDKKSNRPHRSKNIVDALKYAYDLEETPNNIADAVKNNKGQGGGATWETLFEDDLEFVGQAPGICGCKTPGTKELYDSLTPFSDFVSLTIGDTTRNTGVGTNPAGTKQIYSNNSADDTELSFDVATTYEITVGATCTAGTYHVLLKKLVY